MPALAYDVVAKQPGVRGPRPATANQQQVPAGIPLMSVEIHQVSVAEHRTRMQALGSGWWSSSTMTPYTRSHKPVLALQYFFPVFHLGCNLQPPLSALRCIRSLTIASLAFHQIN